LCRVRQRTQNGDAPINSETSTLALTLHVQ
jgi:hypothetical protein